MNDKLTGGQAIAIFGIMIALAFIIETIVEALIGKPIDEFPKIAKYKKYILTYLAVAVGIYGAWVYHFDLIYLLVSYVQEMIQQPLPIGPTGYGITATGFAIGMGSSYLHEFMKRFFLKKEVEGTVK